MITVTGGEAPYRYNFEISNTGIFSFYDLPLSENNLVFFDNAGSVVHAIFTIDHDGVGDCSQFTFERDQGDNISTNLYQETFLSEISATIYVSLDAINVSDSLLVTVNGNVVVSFSAGDSPCDGPSQSVVIDSFCVSICDDVEFTVFGDICPLNSTLWDLTVTCEEKGGLGLQDFSDNISNRSNSNRRTDRYFEELRLNSIHTADVFPNPVSDVLNIANLDPWFGYENVRIINSTGKVVRTENV